MTKKKAYKELLAVAVLSATLGSGSVWAADTSADADAAAIAAARAGVDTVSVNPVTTEDTTAEKERAEKEAAENGTLVTPKVQKAAPVVMTGDTSAASTGIADSASEEEAIASARGGLENVSTNRTTPNGSVTRTVDNSSLATDDKNVLVVAKASGAKLDEKQAETSTQVVTNVDAQYVSSVTDEALKPFVGKTITSIHVSPIDDAHQAQYLALLDDKIGDKLTIDGIKNDIIALGNTGVFSEVNPVITEVPEGVKVDYKLTANPVIKGVSVTGNTVYSTDTLIKYLDLKPGTVLNSIDIGQKVQGINAAYSRDGYILAHVTGVNVDNDGILNLNIVEGIVEGIHPHGNKKTKDYVITREFNQKVGKPFNKFLVRRSVEKIYNTGYFEDVNVRLQPGSEPDKVNIEVDVLEQKTGTLTLGAGYSESDGFVGIVEVGENNLRGTGDKVKLHWEFGGAGKYKNYQISYTKPWIDSKGTSLSFSLFNRQDDYTDYDAKGNDVSEYDKRATGFNISLGRQTGEYTRDYLTLETRKDSWVNESGDMSGYRYDKNSDYAENKGYDFADFDYIGKNFGRTNSITWQKVYDSRDNVYDPTRGRRLSGTVQWAGHGLGGDFDFFKFTGEYRGYRKVGHAQVLAARARIGWAIGDVPYSQLFTAGGSDTLRGYEDDQFRGKKAYNATLEYRFPLVKKVTGVVFTDVGDAWDAPDVLWYEDKKGFNASVGAGVRVNTPIGPVRLDYGWGNDGGKFHFSFGGQF